MLFVELQIEITGSSDVEFLALLNRHTALELAGHVLFDVVDETYQDNFTELTIPLTRSDGISD